ncbi:MAG: wax ester/triacylglycerol synthase family O-acyltransferase [Acidimicrobiia bacterium]
MQRLTGLDAAFLSLETPTNHMHVLGVAVLDPSTAPDGFSFASFKERVAQRLSQIPPFRRRLVNVPFGLYHPLWVEDPTFDLDYHLRRVGLPAPGGPAELVELAGDIAGRPLDRSRPLWEMWYAEGMEHGHVAVVAKIHHCAMDGAGAVELMANLFDLEPDPGPDPAPLEAWRPEQVPTDLETTIGAMVSMATHPIRMAKAAGKIARSATRVTRRIRSERVHGGVPFSAPRVSFNGSLTAHRRVAFSSVPLDDVKLVKNAFDVTVNDVVLAVCTGALRRYLDDGGELPDKPLVATIPVTVRTEDQQGTMGNRLSAMFTELPTHVADPAEQLLAARDVMIGAKQIHDAVDDSALQDLSELVTPAFFMPVARFYTQSKLADRHPPIHNVVVSNVPGPRFPIYVAGAKLMAINPLGPVADGCGLNVTVMSYLDSVSFGLIGCRELIPALGDIAGAVPDALADLVKAASTR